MALTLDGTGNGKVGDATVPLGTGTLGVLVRATAQSATGTSVDFTGIPDTASRVTVMLNGVSTNGTSPNQIQLGSGTIDVSGYASVCGVTTTVGGVSATTSTTGLIINDGGSAAAINDGSAILVRLSGNTWVIQSVLSVTGVAAPEMNASGGRKTLSGPLDRIRLTTVNGTDQFDAGTVNVMWE